MAGNQTTLNLSASLMRVSYDSQSYLSTDFYYILQKTTYVGVVQSVLELEKSKDKRKVS